MRARAALAAAFSILLISIWADIQPVAAREESFFPIHQPDVFEARLIEGVHELDNAYEIDGVLASSQSLDMILGKIGPKFCRAIEVLSRANSRLRYFRSCWMFSKKGFRDRIRVKSWTKMPGQIVRRRLTGISDTQCDLWLHTCNDILDTGLFDGDIRAQLSFGGFLSPLREPVGFYPEANRRDAQYGSKYRQNERIESDGIARRPYPKGFAYKLLGYAVIFGMCGGLFICFLGGVFSSGRAQRRKQDNKTEHKDQGRTDDSGPVDFSM